MNFTKLKIKKDYKAVYYFLKEEGFSENYITNLRKKEGYIKVNNKIANTKTPLNIGDLLEINNNPNSKTKIQKCIIPLDIVYEDEYYLLLIRKVGFLACQTEAITISILQGQSVTI